MKRLSDRRHDARSEGGDVNPMDGLANMADTMLILAVGIMLALIINWKVDINTVAYTDPAQTPDTQDAITFEEEDMELAEGEAAQVDGADLQKLGTVYYDEKTKTYYVIESEEGA